MPQQPPATPSECRDPFPNPPPDNSGILAKFSWIADLIRRLAIAWRWEVEQIEEDTSDRYLPSSLPSAVKEGVIRFFPLAADVVIRHGNALEWPESECVEFANLLRTSAEHAEATECDDDQVGNWIEVSECEIDIEALRQKQHALQNAVARGLSTQNAGGNEQTSELGTADSSSDGALPGTESGLEPSGSAHSTQARDSARFSQAELVARFELQGMEEALRSRLKRLRKNDHTCFDEIADPGHRESRFLYRLDAIMPTIKSLQATKVTGERPTKKNSDA